MRVQAAGDGPPPSVVRFECPNATYQEFGTVYKALSRV